MRWIEKEGQEFKLPTKIEKGTQPAKLSSKLL
jgi:hypothetical protein